MRRLTLDLMPMQAMLRGLILPARDPSATSRADRVDIAWLIEGRCCPQRLRQRLRVPFRTLVL
jgi:hypothetical protein